MGREIGTLKKGRHQAVVHLIKWSYVISNIAFQFKVTLMLAPALAFALNGSLLQYTCPNCFQETMKNFLGF